MDPATFFVEGIMILVHMDEFSSRGSNIDIKQ